MCYQNYYIARLASKFVKVSLSGAGGDELFGGYPWRYEGRRPPSPGRLRALLLRLLVPARAAVRARLLLHEGDARGRRRLDTFDTFRDVLAPVRELDPHSKALYFERKTFLNGLLVVEDRVSMAHSLEARVPFLDNALADLAGRIPSQLLCSGGEGKPVLRAAAAGLLPEDIVRGRKQGFSPPDRSWYRGPTMDYIRAILLDDRSLSRGWFEPDAIRRTINEHIEGRINHRLLLWSLLSFEWWNRLFMDGDPVFPRGGPAAGAPRPRARAAAPRRPGPRGPPKPPNLLKALPAAATSPPTPPRAGGAHPLRGRPCGNGGGRGVLEIVDHDLVDVRIQAGPMTASQKYDELMPLLDQVGRCGLGSSARSARRPADALPPDPRQPRAGRDRLRRHRDPAAHAGGARGLGEEGAAPRQHRGRFAQRGDEARRAARARREPTGRALHRR